MAIMAILSQMAIVAWRDMSINMVNMGGCLCKVEADNLQKQIGKSCIG